MNDRLVVGAKAIAAEVFGGALSPRAVYRLLEGDPTWPVFKINGKWAARTEAMALEIRRREERRGQLRRTRP